MSSSQTHVSVDAPMAADVLGPVPSPAPVTPDTQAPLFSQDVHTKEQSSILSSDTQTVHSYTGFRNLALLILALSNLRLVIENISKYGWLVNVGQLFTAIVEQDLDRWPGLSTYLGLHIFVAAAFAVEKMASLKVLPSALADLLHAINCILVLVITCYSVWVVPSNLAVAMLLVLWACVVHMKLVSYACVNHAARLRKKKGPSAKADGTAAVSYPANVTVGDISWFLIAPTLCYQLSYPRSERVRRGWLFRRIVECIFLCTLIFILAQQYVVPTVQNSMLPLAELHLIKIAERILKLSVPNFCIWLVGFYALFHVYLNILSELLRFGDRQFYLDWWNSTTVSRYWRTWNLPVHHWLLQHIYHPVVRRWKSRQLGYFACFFVSAIMHELVISVAFRKFGYFAFLSMLAQIPLCYLTDHLKGQQLGNVILWFTLLLGQPLGIVLYYQQWYDMQRVRAAA